MMRKRTIVLAGSSVVGLGFLALIAASIMALGGPTVAQAAAPLSAPGSSAGKAKNEAGITALRAGDYRQAAAHFRDAIQEDSGLAAAHYNLGIALHEMEQHMAAKDHFKSALELAPENPRIANSKILEAHMKM